MDAPFTEKHTCTKLTPSYLQIIVYIKYLGADEANYDWWETCIANFQKKDYLASLYAKEHGWDAVNEVLYQVGSYDLEDQANAEIAALEEEFGEVEI